ncbi:hypothetical protein ACFL6S_16790 [Candidatus Poribacteria bacterium]
MKHFVILFSFIVLLFAGIGQLYAADILFQAFSGEAPIPNADAENADAWSDNNVTAGTIAFQVANDHLKEIANECVATTKTLLPGVDGANWVNYTVSMDVWYQDDDAIGIIFRYTNEESFYSFVVAGADTNFNNQWYVGNASAGEGVCFFDSPRFGEPLESGPNNPALAQNIPYTMMVSVTGPKIEVFFGPQIPREDILKGVTPPKLGEVTDSKYGKGKVGIYISSCPAEFANILVMGLPGAVDAEGKLATTWADIKRL